jgi:hypothetical protein
MGSPSIVHCRRIFDRLLSLDGPPNANEHLTLLLGIGSRQEWFGASAIRHFIADGHPLFREALRDVVRCVSMGAERRARRRTRLQSGTNSWQWQVSSYFNGLGCMTSGPVMASNHAATARADLQCC